MKQISYPGTTGSVTYAYDAANRLTTVTDWNSNATTYSYDNANRMTSVTFPAATGVVSTYSYDNADRLTGIVHQQGGNTIDSVAYTLDAVGNRTQRVDGAGTHSYAYDDLYRLTSVTYPGPSTTSYAFDAFGNRTSLTDASGTTTYAYDDADRLTSVTPPSPAPVVSYTWDDNGNLTNRGSDSFSWDYEDRMVSATVGGTTTTFAYRGDGLRDSRTTGGTTTTFTWDIGGGLPVVLDDGGQYVYGLGLVCQVNGANTYYYLSDGLGSMMAMVDGSGTVVKTYGYDVYGKVTSSSGSAPNEFDFAAQQTDPTGLQYLRARYYDTETGRFLSREPMMLAPGWAGNPFVYADARPTGLVDRDGLTPTPPPENDPCYIDQGPSPQCPPPTGDPGDLGWLGKAWELGLDTAAYELIFSFMFLTEPLVGEYLHNALHDCAMDDACRTDISAIINGRKAMAGAPLILLEKIRALGLGMVYIERVWWAYKRAFGSNREGLRNRVRALERRLGWND